MRTQMEATWTVGDIKRHKGEIRAFVNLFGHDGEYFKLSKADVLRTIGADVPYSRDGLADSTPITDCRMDAEGVLYIG